MSACVADGSNHGVSSQVQALEANVCVSSTPEYDPSDPRCQTGGPAGTGVIAPAPCPGSEPTCNRAQSYPTQLDLSVSNSQNLVFSSALNSLALSAGSGSLIDTDGDGVPDPADDCAGPGWRLPCDGDPSNDGAYQTAYFDASSAATLSADIQIRAQIQSADAYILMDSTGSMGGEQAQLVTDLTSGTFVDPIECPTGAGTGLVGALKCVVPDIWMGVGQFHEVPLLPHSNPFASTPYHHLLDTTNNIQYLLDAVSALTTRTNRDLPEAGSQALYSIVTGEGLGPWVPNRGACPSSPPGRWGYPCFRPNVLPIIIIFSDAGMHNGPLPTSSTYGNPPFDGTLGLGMRLPPVEQDPAMIYSSGVLSAHDLGDLTSKSVTVMGSNVNFGNDFTTWTVGGCNYCPTSGCWGDGRDGVVQFSLSAPTSTFVSGEGTFYPFTNLAVVDSSLGYLACDNGPGGGDSWGRTTQALGAGSWYAVSDAAIAPSSSVGTQIGPFQIRIQTTPDDPSWQTRDMPIPWVDVETELLAKGVKVVTIVSPNSGGLIGLPDLTELGIVTNSVDQSGQPYLEQIAGDGTGLSTALLDAVRALVGDTRRDVTIGPEDNASTAVDETRFVSTVTAAQCPTSGLSNCTGGQGTGMCLGCLADANLQFQFRVGNDFVPSAATAQVFDFDMVVLVDGSIEIDRFPVRVMVPPTGSNFGAGHFQDTYDSDFVCVMPPERPDWGILTWSGATPSDSKIEFEFFTANTLAELDTQIPVSLVIPDDTTATSIDVGAYLVANGLVNYMPFLRVRAKLQASTDTLTTPQIDGWTMQFDCIPFD